MKDESPYSRKPAAFDPRTGGGAQSLLPAKSKSAEFSQRLLRTVVFTGLFLLVCKLTHFRQKVLYDTRINRKFLGVFYGFCGTFGIIYVYMAVTLRYLRPQEKRVAVDDWDKEAPIPLYTASACLAFAMISFIFALWPCFQLSTFGLGILGFMAMIFVIQWLPF
jgi:hypothetical protein